MDITQLRYFLKTAETLNYTRAAEALFITRQSLRQAIACVEGELGAPLFHKERNHLSLTESGTYLALTGARVIRDFDDMWTNTLRLASRQAALKVAFSESLVPFLLPDLDDVLQRFRTRFPHIPLEVCKWDMDRVLDAAEAGEIDCGCVLQMPRPQPGCKVRVLKRFPAALDFGEDFPLYDRPREPLKLEELDGLPCVGMGSPQRFMAPLWEDCLRKGIHLDYRVIPNTIDAFYQVQNSLAAGFDILDDGNLGARPIRSALLPDYSWELTLLCPEDRPDRGSAELFRAFLDGELACRYEALDPDGPLPFST